MTGFTVVGAQGLSDTVFDARSRGCGFKLHPGGTALCH